MRWTLPMSRGIGIFLLIALAACGKGGADQYVDKRPFHERLLVLDTHLDTPVNFGRQAWDFRARHTYDNDLSQVDLPRMREGGLDGGFFVIYTEQGPLTPEGYFAARTHALKRATEIAQTVARNKDMMELARTPEDALRIARAGKRIVFQSLENSYPLGENVDKLEDFYSLGVRMAGPVHGKTNQFADSATGEVAWHGLSPLGKEWVAEMNKLGMVIDASHASDEAFDQLLDLSKTPIILSHSGPKWAFDHPRNLDDDRIRRLADKGGVIQVNSIFLAATDGSPERNALFDQRERRNEMSPVAQQAVTDKWMAMDKRHPFNPATFEMFMASLLHVLKVAGADHVGIGADWDGGGGVTGMNDVSALPRITAGLQKAGYSDADIAKIWSGNTLRVLAQAEAAAERPGTPR